MHFCVGVYSLVFACGLCIRLRFSLHLCVSLHNVYVVGPIITLLRAVSVLSGLKSVARDLGPRMWVPAFGPRAVSALSGPKSVAEIWAPGFEPQHLGPGR